MSMGSSFLKMTGSAGPNQKRQATEVACHPWRTEIGGVTFPHLLTLAGATAARSVLYFCPVHYYVPYNFIIHYFVRFSTLVAARSLFPQGAGFFCCLAQQWLWESIPFHLIDRAFLNMAMDFWIFWRDASPKGLFSFIVFPNISKSCAKVYPHACPSRSMFIAI